MLKYVWFTALLSVFVALFVTTCVKSEKRATKQVDVSGAQIYQTDMTKPRIRVAVYTPQELKSSVAERFFIEIDDGAMRYGFTSSALAPDSADTSGTIYSPWVNTPDSGQVSFKFSLSDNSGASMISDQMTMQLVSEHFWQVTIGVFSSDPCPGIQNVSLCRNYTLPRAVQSVEEDRLYVFWQADSLAAPGDSL